MKIAAKPEAALQRLILDWLAANHIWHERRNTRTIQVPGVGGRMRPMFFGKPGTADIMATYQKKIGGVWMLFLVWIEVKAPKGKQSEVQQKFQREVEDVGHSYVLAYSLEDVINALT